MPIRKLARTLRTLDAALTDADRARKKVRDPEFRKGVQKDRRGELSAFRTVKHLLTDRARIEKAKAAKKKKG